jgi:transposase, IS5 family
VRAKVEHPFRVIKRQFSLVKVQFRGLAKNTAHVTRLFALSNLWMARKQLMAAMAAVRNLWSRRDSTRPTRAGSGLVQTLPR